jgi:hypothetical protein
MAMAANLIARYIWEINELSRSHRGLTLNELNRRWENSKFYDGKEIIRKTWHSHRQQILMQFGIDIACDKPNNRYYIAHREGIGQPEKITGCPFGCHAEPHGAILLLWQIDEGN